MSRTYVRFRDRVEAAVVPRVAAADPPHGEPGAAPARRGASSASSAYCEHDGWKRQRGGRCTLSSRQARIGSIRSRAERGARRRDDSARCAVTVASAPGGAHGAARRPCARASVKASVSTDGSACEEIGAARGTSSSSSRHRGAEAPADPVALHRGAATAGRSRTPRAAGRSDPSARKRSETGPARCRRARARASNVARSRTRQIRPRDASGRGRGGPAARLARPCVRIRSAEAVGLGALAIVGLERALQATGLLEAAARGPRAGTAREAETTQCTAPSPLRAMRSVEHRESGETLAAPCRTRTPVLRCAPRSAAAGRPRTSPVCHSSTRPRPVHHIWAISTPVDAPVDNATCGRLTALVDERRTVAVTADEIWDQGSATLRDAARARDVGDVVPRGPPRRLRRRRARAGRARARWPPSASARATAGCSPTPSATPPA